jgi:PHP domain
MMNRIRAACHVHSTWSYDGKWKLEQLAKAFAKRNYRVVLITEHDQGFDESKRLEHREACRMASTEKILLIPGIEYSDPSNVVHLLVWGDVPFIGSKAEPEGVLAATCEYGGVTVFAHPSRKEAWKRFTPNWSTMLLGIEFWNRKTDGWAPSKHAWSLLQKTNLMPLAGLDFHDSRQFFPMATFLEMQDPINEATVLAALRARRCVSKVFGLEAPAFARGVQTKVLHNAESLRRVAASLYRAAASSLTGKAAS